MDFSSAVARYLEYLRVERNCSAHTLRNYASDLKQFGEFLRTSRAGEACPALGELTHLDIRSYLGELYAARLKAASIGRKLACLRSLFRFLAREEMVKDNPARLVSSPKLPKTLPAVPTAEEVSMLLDAMPADDAPMPARDRAMLEMLYGSGLRVGELVALNVEHVDRRQGLLRVRGKGKKERLAPLGAKAAEALERYLPLRRRMLAGRPPDAPQPALFLNLRGGRLTSRSVGRIVKRWTLLLNADTGLHPHSFRHAFATHLLSDGADLRAIQEMLGHARLSSTQKYTHTNIRQLMEVYDRCHPKA